MCFMLISEENVSYMINIVLEYWDDVDIFVVFGWLVRKVNYGLIVFEVGVLVWFI